MVTGPYRLNVALRDVRIYEGVMRRGLIAGIVGLILLTVIFRMTGGMLFARFSLLSLLAVSGVISAVLSLILCRFVCQPGKMTRFGAGLAIPGLLGGAAAVVAFATIFPEIPSDRADDFAAIVLWANGIILASVLLFGEKVVRQE